MNNFTEAQKEELEAMNATHDVASIAYDPNTVTGTPEADALADDWEEYYREDEDDLVEVIYIRLK